MSNLYQIQDNEDSYDSYRLQQHSLTMNELSSTVDTLSQIPYSQFDSYQYSQDYQKNLYNSSKCFLQTNQNAILQQYEITIAEDFEETQSQESFKNTIIMVDSDNNQQVDKVQLRQTEQQSKFLYIYNSKCEIEESSKCNYKKDRILLFLNEIVQLYATQYNINIDGSRCTFDQQNKIFLIYDNHKGTFNFFQISESLKREDVKYCQINYKLQDNQLFCLKGSDNVICISRQEEDNLTILDTFQFDMNKQLISILEEKVIEIYEQVELVHIYYYNDKLDYVYRKLLTDVNENEDGDENDEEHECKQSYFLKDDTTEFIYLLFDVYNNFLAITSDQIFYNGECVFNEKYSDYIKDIINYFINCYDYNSIFHFKSKQKYQNDQVLKCKFIDFKQNRQIIKNIPYLNY